MEQSTFWILTVLALMFFLASIVLIWFYFTEKNDLVITQHLMTSHTTFLERTSRVLSPKIDIPTYVMGKDREWDKILQECFELSQNRKEYILMVDEDISLASAAYWDEPLSYYLQQVPEGWQVLFLTGSVRKGCSFPVTTWIDPEEVRDKGSHLPQAFVLSRSGLEILRKNETPVEVYQISPPLLSLESKVVSRVKNLPYLTSQLSVIESYRDKAMIYHLSDPHEELLFSLMEPVVLCDKDTPCTRIDIIVSYYDRDLTWLEQILRTQDRNSFRLFLYQKGPTDPNLSPTMVDKHIRLNNLGRCDNTHVYHFWSTYHKPHSRYLLFLKDSSFRYFGEGDLARLMQTYEGPKPYGPRIIWQADYVLNLIRQCYYSFFDYENVDHFLLAPSKFRPLHAWYREVIQREPDIQQLREGIHAATFICCNSVVTSLSRELWARLLLTLSYGSNIETGHYMEHIWGQILHEDLR